MDITREQQLARRTAFVLVVLVAAMAATFVARQVIVHSNFPFDTDEANHANSGLALFLELRAGDFRGFITEFYNQSFYPPGVSWILALLFWFFGVSSLVARLFSTASFFLALLVMYALGQAVDGQRGWLAGLIAVGLTAVSHAMLVNSALAMLEMPGLLVSLLFLWAYVVGIKRPSPRRFLLTSILLAFTFLTKYTFGVITTATVILFELSLFASAWSKREKAAAVLLAEFVKERWLWLFGLYGLVVLAWLGRPDKWAGFFGFSRPLSADEPWLSPQNWLFYLRSLALLYSPAPLLVLFAVPGIVWAVIRWRDEAIRLLLIYFGVGMASIMLINHPTNSRFIATVAPIMNLLAGLGLAQMLLDWRAKRGRWWATAVCSLIIVLISLPAVVERLAAYPSVLEVAYESDAQKTELAMWIEAQVPQDASFYLINYWDQFSPQTLAWYLGKQHTRAADFADVVPPAALLEPATPENIAAFQQDVVVSGVTYLVIIEGGPWGTPFWPDYTAALAGNLVHVAQEKFPIVRYGGYNWLERSFFSREEWDEVRAKNFKSFEIQAVVYRLDPPLPH